MAIHLALDIGNSRTKLGLFTDGRLARPGVMLNGDIRAVHDFAGPDVPVRIVAGSVAAEDPVLLKALQSMAPVHMIAGSSPAPLVNAYGTTATLGADRLANAVAATMLFPGRAVLAIALGTCVTYDLVEADGVYRGGLISPGLRMRARAMHEFTAKLPQVEPQEEPPLVGKSTVECLASGMHHGLRAELSTLIAEFRQQHPGLAVVLTGGDAPRFARALENGIFAHPFLTLLGLHALLLHQLTIRNPAVAGGSGDRPGPE